MDGWAGSCFFRLERNIDLAEKFLKNTIHHVLEKNKEDLEILEKRLIEEDKLKPKEKRNEMSLIEKLNFIVNNNLFWGQDRLEYALEEINSN